MIDLPVHPLTYKTILAERHAPLLLADRKAAFWPALTSRPVHTNAPMTRSIRIDGPRRVLMAVHPQAGYNLYELHMHQLIQYMCRRQDMGHAVWSAMEEYYDAIDLDIDELAPETTYKRWQRYVREREAAKTRENNLYFAPRPVSRITSAANGGPNHALEIAAALIGAHPDLFHTFAGIPDRFMICRAVMYAMHAHLGWRQDQIAEHFRITQQAVSHHIRTFRGHMCLPKRRKSAPDAALTGLPS